MLTLASAKAIVNAFDSFGWDDWRLEGDRYVSPSGKRKLTVETYQRLKAAAPSAGPGPKVPDAQIQAAVPEHVFGQYQAGQMPRRRVMQVARKHPDWPAISATKPAAPDQYPGFHPETATYKPPPGVSHVLAAHPDVKKAATSVIPDAVAEHLGGIPPAVKSTVSNALNQVASAGDTNGFLHAMGGLVKFVAKLPLKVARATAIGLYRLAKFSIDKAGGFGKSILGGGGLAGGAWGGAQLGGLIGGPLGAAIGTGVGGAIGALAGTGNFTALKNLFTLRGTLTSGPVKSIAVPLLAYVGTIAAVSAAMLAPWAFPTAMILAPELAGMGVGGATATVVKGVAAAGNYMFGGSYIGAGGLALLATAAIGYPAMMWMRKMISVHVGPLAARLIDGPSRATGVDSADYHAEPKLPQKPVPPPKPASPAKPPAPQGKPVYLKTRVKPAIPYTPPPGQPMPKAPMGTVVGILQKPKVAARVPNTPQRSAGGRTARTFPGSFQTFSWQLTTSRNNHPKAVWQGSGQRKPLYGQSALAVVQQQRGNKFALVKAGFHAARAAIGDNRPEVQDAARKRLSVIGTAIARKVVPSQKVRQSISTTAHAVATVDRLLGKAAAGVITAVGRSYSFVTESWVGKMWAKVMDAVFGKPVDGKGRESKGIRGVLLKTVGRGVGKAITAQAEKWATVRDVFQKSFLRGLGSAAGKIFGLFQAKYRANIKKLGGGPLAIAGATAIEMTAGVLDWVIRGAIAKGSPAIGTAAGLAIGGPAGAGAGYIAGKVVAKILPSVIPPAATARGLAMWAVNRHLRSRQPISAVRQRKANAQTLLLGPGGGKENISDRESRGVLGEVARKIKVATGKDLTYDPRHAMGHAANKPFVDAVNEHITEDAHKQAAIRAMAIRSNRFSLRRERGQSLGNLIDVVRQQRGGTFAETAPQQGPPVSVLVAGVRDMLAAMGHPNVSDQDILPMLGASFAALGSNQQQPVETFAWKEGPRGGKYWLPEGKPDQTPNRIYGIAAQRAAAAEGKQKPQAASQQSASRPQASVKKPLAEVLLKRAQEEAVPLTNKYLAQHGTKDATGRIVGATFNTDEWRPLFPEYTGTNAAETHDAATYLNDRAFEQALTGLKGRGNGKMIVLAGGGGSGKGSAAKMKDLEAYPLRLDQTSSDFDKLMKKFALGQQHGFSPEYTFIDRHPEKAWEGVVGRAISGRAKGGVARTVPLDIALKANLDARDVALRVLKERPDIPASVIDNNGGPLDARMITDRAEAIRHLEGQKHEFASLRQRLFAPTAARPDLPEDIRKGLLGPDAGHAPTSAAKGSQSSAKPHRTIQTPTPAGHAGSRGKAQPRGKQTPGRSPSKAQVTPTPKPTGAIRKARADHPRQLTAQDVKHGRAIQKAVAAKPNGVHVSDLRAATGLPKADFDRLATKLHDAGVVRLLDDGTKPADAVRSPGNRMFARIAAAKPNTAQTFRSVVGRQRTEGHFSDHLKYFPVTLRV